MTQRNDGEPAFPVDPDVAGHEALRGSAMGMTLRDYFAAKAMQGLRSAGAKRSAQEGLLTAEDIADLAYQDADAMLAQRKNHD